MSPPGEDARKCDACIQSQFREEQIENHVPQMGRRERRKGLSLATRAVVGHSTIQLFGR